MSDLAIRLRGVVKRYGPITAVNGLDLDVPEGTCVGLLGPNGAGKSTTMRLLTAQAIADEGELEVLGYKLPEESKIARAQCGVVPQLDNLDVTLTVEQNLLVFTHLYRVPRAERQAAIEAGLKMAKLVDRRDTRVDKLSGGMRRRLLIARALVHRPRLALLDEPTVGLDPQVRQELWALIDALRAEGTTILMSTHYIEEAERLADTVLIMSHGSAVASGPPAELIREHAGTRGGRGLRPAREARRDRAGRAGRRVPHAPHRNQRVRARHRERRRPRARGGAPPTEPGGRVRPPDRRGDPVVATRVARPITLHRLERPAITGVLVREAVNFSSYWRSASFSSTVEPTIYLLAFGFGFGSLVEHGRRLRLRRLHRHGDRRDGRPLLERLPGDVRDVREVQVPAHLRRDPGRARGHGGARHRRGALDRAAHERLRLRADDRRDLLRARAVVGDAARPGDRFVSGYGWANFGIAIAGFAKSFENFNYIVSAVLTPLFLVAGTFFPITNLPEWAQLLANLNPLYQCVELVRAAVFELLAWSDLRGSATWCCSGWCIWRIAIRAMTQKLVD